MSFTKKEITVLNIDIDGFSTIYRAIKAEKTTELMNRFYSELSESVLANGGEVVEFLGDGFIAMFAREGCNALDAVKAALSMKEKIAGMNASGLPDKCPEIKAPIVLAGGEAFVGYFGTGSYERFNAIGDAVNASFSIAHKASGNQLLVNETVYEAVKDSVNVREEIKIQRRHHDNPFICYDICSLK